MHEAWAQYINDDDQKLTLLVIESLQMAMKSFHHQHLCSSSSSSSSNTQGEDQEDHWSNTEYRLTVLVNWNEDHLLHEERVSRWTSEILFYFISYLLFFHSSRCMLTWGSYPLEIQLRLSKFKLPDLHVKMLRPKIQSGLRNVKSSFKIWPKIEWKTSYWFHLLENSCVCFRTFVWKNE